MYNALFHLQYHDRGALEQGTEPPTAPRAPQHKWLPTAPGVCSQCVCVFTAVCVHLGWVKCRAWAQIPSMGNHTWPHVTSLSHKFERNIIDDKDLPCCHRLDHPWCLRCSRFIVLKFGIRLWLEHIWLKRSGCHFSTLAVFKAIPLTY